MDSFVTSFEHEIIKIIKKNKNKFFKTLIRIYTDYKLTLKAMNIYAIDFKNDFLTNV